MSAYPKIDYRDTVVLFSGGMDSTVALFDRLERARKAGVGRVHTLTIAYDQRHEYECEAARRILSFVSKLDHYAGILGRLVQTGLHMPRLGSLMDRKLPVMSYADEHDADRRGDDDTAFMPYRNLMMLTLAAQYAFKLGAGVISTGLRGGFPDCTSAYESSVRDILHASVPDFPLRIETPTHNPRVSALHAAKALPGCWEAIGMSWTCFAGDAHNGPCGHCLPCLKRATGFAALGERDPALPGPDTLGAGPR